MALKNDIFIYDENKKRIDVTTIENKEQVMVQRHIQPTDRVLELGARYGSVSVRVNKILKDKTKHVVVEPDRRVWKALTYNRYKNNTKFKIFQGFVANKKYKLVNKKEWSGYAATMVEDEGSNIPSITLTKLLKKVGFQPNVLIADCEGCLCDFMDENPDFISQLRMVMFESDYPDKCSYEVKVAGKLLAENFTNKESWGDQHVWIKES